MPILIADTSDPASFAALATCARVVLSCAGLFRFHGHAVAAACATVGADCLDISEEPGFMERVEAELHEPTARSGSLIVSACGFGFVPAEFGFLFHSRQWEVGTPLRAGHRGGVREPSVDQEDRREHRHLRVSCARSGQRWPAAGAAPVQTQATPAQCELISTLCCF